MFKKIKNYLFIYLFIIFLLVLSASFVSENIFDISSEIDLSSETIIRIYENNIGIITTQTSETESSEEESETQVEGADTYDGNTYKLGDENSEIIEYQEILSALGLTTESASGIFTEDTERAVETYQASKNIDVTGELDAATIVLLKNEEISYELGDQNDVIKDYQEILYYLDYLDDSGDGIFGEKTELAVKNYQEEKDLNVTGILDKTTMTNLDGEAVIYKIGYTGDKIKYYQEILIDIGYLDSEATGTFGELTHAAVNAYQEDENIDVTGEIDLETQQHLEKE
jgi:peptidoglycan hydrolase-like protein with peptidoglycan-binding domain